MNFKSWARQNLGRFIWIGVFVCFAASYLAQLHHDVWRRFGTSKIKTTYNIFIEPQPLSSTNARFASFGATEFMADWYWLSLIQYYGGGEPQGHYRKLAEMFNTVTDLSPKFKDAYQNGLIVLPGEGFPDEAIALGKKGQQNLPDSWEMPYYTGLVYHINKKDYLSAAKEFELAASKDGAPPITKLFSAIYFKEANQRQIAYEIFKTVYQTTDNDFVKDRAERYVGHLDAVFTLEDAVQKFKTQFGRYPSALNELVSRQILTELPVSPLSRTFGIDAATGQITESK